MVIVLAAIGFVYFMLFGLHCHFLKCNDRTMERLVALVYLLGAVAYGGLAYAEVKPSFEASDHAGAETRFDSGFFGEADTSESF